jgi:hypothetical protein
MLGEYVIGFEAFAAEVRRVSSSWHDVISQKIELFIYMLDLEIRGSSKTKRRFSQKKILLINFQ